MRSSRRMTRAADPKTSDVADVTASILSSRLVDTVREKLGITYSPMVSADTSLDIQGQGYFTAAIETPQANFGTFHGLLAEQLKDLAAKPVSADELARAKQPLIEGQRKKLETNDYWLGKLTQMTREPRVRDQALEELDNIQKVTAADVQALAAKYLAGRQPVVAIAKAEGSQEPVVKAAATGGSTTATDGLHIDVLSSASPGSLVLPRTRLWPRSRSACSAGASS